MGVGKPIRKGLIFGITALFIVSAVSPMVIGLKSDTVDVERDEFLDNLAFYYYDEYDSSKLEDYKEYFQRDNLEIADLEEITTPVESPQTSVLSGPMDSAWPMQCYNRQHIGRSPYSTISNSGIEKWRFAATDWTDGSPVIGEDGTIYFGGGTGDAHLYAVYPNGTLKWKFEAESGIGSFGISSAIANDGTLYFSTIFGSHIQAVNPNGTAKWKCWTSQIETSITLDDDGVLYYGAGKRLEARYPNGTLKWKFSTGDVVQSTPAIDDNGMIYFGSHDDYVYASYPNGTLKWKFKTNGWIHGSPTIGNDGTVYIGSDDDYLYALYSENGTMKWKVMVGAMRSSPSLDKEDNLYFGVSDSKIYSVSPNGTIRWSFDLRERDSVWGSTAAISDDGTVYIGSNIDYNMLGGGEIIALNPDGTEKWRKTLSNSLLESSPVISEDGVVYICASNDLIHPDGPGHLHAFGPVDSNVPPETPTIEGSIEGLVGEYYKYQISTEDADNNPIAYFIDWGDGTDSGWTSDYAPGIVISKGHTWKRQGTYTVKVKARDTFGAESEWGELEVTMPMNQHSYSFPLLQRLLERFPNAFPILRHLMGL